MTRSDRLTWMLAVAVGLAGPPAAAQDAPPAEAAPSPSAGPGPGGPPGGGPMGGGPPGYDATWYPSQAVDGQSADFGFVRQGLSVGAPVWRGDAGMVMARVGVRSTHFFTDAVLPDSGRAFPDELTNVTVGATYLHRFDNGWTGGLMLGVGSASDRPFHSIDEMTANVGAFLRVPVCDGRDAWQFSLLYMSGGAVNFPIPMAAYSWNPSDRLRVNIGLPFSIFWQPADDWTVDLSYVPLNNVNARVTYTLAPAVRLYGGYEFLNESYLLAGRADREDRFFAFEQRLVTGLRWDVAAWATVELNGGYSFGRYYGSGDSQWDSLRDRIDIAPGPFVGLSGRLRF